MEVEVAGRGRGAGVATGGAGFEVVGRGAGTAGADTHACNSISSAAIAPNLK
jgi:hypothetical protein